MKNRHTEDLSNLSMLELFQGEAENQAAIITGGLLELEKNPAALEHLEALMRAAHSLKGAARIVNQEAAVGVAHALEDCFVAAQRGRIELRRESIDVLFQGVDILLSIAGRPENELATWGVENATRIGEFLAAIVKITESNASPTSAAPASPATDSALVKPVKDTLPPQVRKGESPDRVLRLTAENLNRLLGLAGESLVESRWLHPFADSMNRLKRLQTDLMESLHHLRDSLEPCDVSERVDDQMQENHREGPRMPRVPDRPSRGSRNVRSSFGKSVSPLVSRSVAMPHAAVRRRRAPRAAHGPRYLARTLGKKVRLEIVGESTLGGTPGYSGEARNSRSTI